MRYHRHMRSVGSAAEAEEVFADPELKRRVLDVMATQIERANLTISGQWEQNGHVVRGSLAEAQPHPFAAMGSLVLNIEVSFDNYERGTVCDLAQIEASVRDALSSRKQTLDPAQLIVEQQRAALDRSQVHCKLKGSRAPAVWV